jgi:hypothetical protein
LFEQQGMGSFQVTQQNNVLMTSGRCNRRKYCWRIRNKSIAITAKSNRQSKQANEWLSPTAQAAEKE